jgi:exopolysaccharide biosynthesis polyprenyl glycosylphosphotransferase
VTLTRNEVDASTAPSSTFSLEEMPSLAAPRRTQRTRRISPKAWLVLADTCTVALAMVLAYAMRISFGGQDLDGARGAHLLVAIASGPVWLGLFIRRRLYNVRFLGRRVDEVRRICSAAAFAIMAMTVAAYAFQLPVSRAWLAMTYATAVALMSLEREVVRRVFGALRRSGRMLRGVVIVGCNQEAREVAEMLEADRLLGYEVVGFVDDGEHAGNGRVLGPVAQTLAVVRRTGANSVIVAASATDLDTSNRLVRELLREGIHVELSSTLRDIAAQRLTVRPLGRFPVVYLEPCESSGWRAFAKRAFDIAVASTVLIATAPFAVIIALAIKLESRGPVIFRQDRVGRDGKVFGFQKFRSMRDGAHAMWIDLRAQSDVSGPIFKMKDDPRVTRVGRLLRKASIDELPQLWNVLRGEMSLVGPRPALPEEMSMWDEPLHDRLRVRPGITGMWQVSGRSDAAVDDYTRLDLYYVDNWSLVVDLVIILKTIPVVLFGRGAY